MSGKHSQQPNTKSAVHKLVFCCIITTILVTTFTLSKFESSIAGQSHTKVAASVMQLTADNPVIPIEVSPIKQDTIYEFRVSNTDGSQQSEVSMEYTLEIQSIGNLPLEFALYTYEGDNIGTTNLLTESGSTADNSKTTLITMPHDTKNPHRYRLHIQWKEGENSHLYSHTIDYVRLILHSTQID